MLKKSLELKVSISKTCHQNIKFEKIEAKKIRRKFYTKKTKKKKKKTNRKIEKKL